MSTARRKAAAGGERLADERLGRHKAGRCRHICPAGIVLPGIIDRWRVEQVEQQARCQIQCGVANCGVSFDRVAGRQSQSGDARPPVSADPVVSNEIAGIPGEVADQDAPVVACDFVVGDLVVRVPGPREQVDPSTELSGHGLGAVVLDSIVADDVAAAAARDHQAVVSVVPQDVVGDLHAAGGDEHDSLEQVHA